MISKCNEYKRTVEDNYVRNVDVDRLMVNSVNITSLGNLTITFNQEILRPRINMTTTEEASTVEGQIITDESYYHVTQAIALSVRESEYSNESKQIEDFTLIQVTNTSISISVAFRNPEAISKPIRDPDFLDVKIIKP